MSFQKQSFNNNDSFISTIFLFCLSWLNHPPQVMICIFPPFPPPFLRPRDATPHQTWFQRSQCLTNLAGNCWEKRLNPFLWGLLLVIPIPKYDTQDWLLYCPFLTPRSSKAAPSAVHVALWFCETLSTNTSSYPPAPQRRPNSHGELWITSLI